METMMRVILYSVSMWVCIAVAARDVLADTVLIVGPEGQYPTLSNAVAAANSDTDLNQNYFIHILPGIYTNDFPHVTRPMTIKVDPRYVGKEVLLKATDEVPNRKGIILTEASLTVDGLTFMGAKIANSLGGNAAGIRDQSTDGPVTLIVRNSTFLENQNGILTGVNPHETITIENSKFKNNGNASITGPPFCCQHAVYVGQAGSLIVSTSLFCGQLIGHNIKSRALMTAVYNNALYNGAANPSLGCMAGSTSFAIDVPNGGGARISGNQIIQGREASNNNLIAYGEEGLRYSSNSLYVSGNNFKSSDVPNATAIYDPHCIPIDLIDNAFSGITTIVAPLQCAAQP